MASVLHPWHLSCIHGICLASMPSVLQPCMASVLQPWSLPWNHGHGLAAMASIWLPWPLSSNHGICLLTMQSVWQPRHLSNCHVLCLAVTASALQPWPLSNNHAICIVTMASVYQLWLLSSSHDIFRPIGVTTNRRETSKTTLMSSTTSSLSLIQLLPPFSSRWRPRQMTSHLSFDPAPLITHSRASPPDFPSAPSSSVSLYLLPLPLSLSLTSLDGMWHTSVAGRPRASTSSTSRLSTNCGRWSYRDPSFPQPSFKNYVLDCPIIN